jgi:hypothetical protein
VKNFKVKSPPAEPPTSQGMYFLSTLHTGPLSCLFQQQTVCHVIFAVGVYFYTLATAIVQAAAMSPAATATPTTAGHQQEQGCQ